AIDSGGRAANRGRRVRDRHAVCQWLARPSGAFAILEDGRDDQPLRASGVFHFDVLSVALCRDGCDEKYSTPARTVFLQPTTHVWGPFGGDRSGAHRADGLVLLLAGVCGGIASHVDYAKCRSPP